MSMVTIDWKPDDVAIRVFARTLMIGFTLIAWVVWYFQGGLAQSREAGVMVWGILPYLWGIPLVLGTLSWLFPAFGRLVYKPWMGIAFVMGTIVSSLILSLVYYLVVTPIGLFMRLRGHDPLRLKRGQRTSNWQERTDPWTPSRMERLS